LSEATVSFLILL